MLALLSELYEDTRSARTADAPELPPPYRTAAESWMRHEYRGCRRKRRSGAR
jgi:hypothetical protein